MKNLLKQLYCNHTSQRCITDFGSKYIDNLYNTNEEPKYTVWVCERCGKVIKKPINKPATTFNWINIAVNK